MPRLNPNATVPGITGDIGDKPLVAVDAAQLAGPIVVDTTGRPPGASKGFKDYIPSAAKRRQILRARGAKVEEPKPSVHTHHVVRHNKDYMSAEDSAKARKKQNTEITKLAKEIWSKDSDHRRRYKQARKIVKEASEAQLDNPSPKIKRALAILEGRKPINKDTAMREARAKIYRT